MKLRDKYYYFLGKILFRLVSNKTIFRIFGRDGRRNAERKIAHYSNSFARGEVFNIELYRISVKTARNLAFLLASFPIWIDRFTNFGTNFKPREKNFRNQESSILNPKLFPFPPSTTQSRRNFSRIIILLDS